MRPAEEDAWHEYGHIVFDIDGTLLNSNTAHVWAWQDAFEAENLFFPHLTMFLQMGLPGEQIVEKFSFSFPDRETADRVRAGAKRIYSERYVSLVQPYDGTYELLETLRSRKRKLYAITSASRQEAQTMLKRFKLEEYFDIVLTGDDVGEGKPHPEPFEVLKKRIGDDAKIISIGDSPYDMAASHAAGVPFVYLGSGGFPREWFAKAHSRFLNIREALNHVPKGVAHGMVA